MASFDAAARAQSLKESANAHFGKKEWENALENWFQALALYQDESHGWPAGTDEKMATLLANRAHVLATKVGKAEDAVREARLACRLAPDYAKAHLRLAVALERSGDASGAAAARCVYEAKCEREEEDPLFRELCGGVDPLTLVGEEAPGPRKSAAASGADAKAAEDMAALSGLTPAQMEKLTAAAVRFRADGDLRRAAACDMRVIATQIFLANLMKKMAARPEAAETLRESEPCPGGAGEAGPGDAAAGADRLTENALDALVEAGSHAFNAKDYALAARVWRIGCGVDETGHLFCNVGMCYRNRDRNADARRYFAEGAARGSGDCWVESGLLLIRGRGGPRDQLAAVDAFERAKVARSPPNAYRANQIHEMEKLLATGVDFDTMTMSAAGAPPPRPTANV